MTSMTPLQFIDCPTCLRRGAVGNTFDQRCPTCGGKGTYTFLDGDWLYWGRKVTRYDYYEEKIKNIFRAAFHFVFFAIAIGGMFWGMYSAVGELDNNLAFATVAEMRGWPVVAFWIGLASALFLYYRIIEDSLSSSKMKFYISDVPIPMPEVDFNAVDRLEEEERTDISQSFNNESMRIVEKAKARASEMHHMWVEPIHLLAELVGERDIQHIFSRLDIKLQAIAPKIMRGLRKMKTRESGEAFISDHFRTMLHYAYEEAYRRRAQKVEITDLLVAVERAESDIRDILYDLEVDAVKLRSVVMWIHNQKHLQKQWRRYLKLARHKPKGVMNRAMTAIATPYLDRFSEDLTQAARIGALPLCVGRDTEIEEVFRLMTTGSQSIVLVGQPGVGKKTIVAGIAERMAMEAVPKSLEDKRMVNISIPAIVAGAAPGELEGRLYRILNEVVRAGNIILVMDDIHNLIGVTSARGEGLDLSEIVSSALGPDILLIGTTNEADYRQWLERSSLGNALAKVDIKEMDEQQTIQVLTTKVGAYEFRQQIYFTYNALKTIVDLSKRYITERFFPAKAIRLLDEVASYVSRSRGKKSMVSAEDVAHVIAAKKSVPVTKITEGETKKLLNLEIRIHERMVDQDEAVDKVAAALRRARAELRDVKRPISTFLFLGPTGVGKTELAKTIAEVYFGDEQNMIRLDMSEYQEPTSIRRLIGAPPGTGGQTGGYLTEAVRNKPFSIVLLDELEKAHPEILNVFLQVFDDGRMTDTLGRTIDFTNTIIIATSNAGTPIIQQRIQEGVAIEAIREELINEILNKHYRPEFLNRFDGILVFKPLSRNEIAQIAGFMLEKVADRLAEKGIMLRATTEAIQELAHKGYDPKFGARPLRRVIQEEVDNALAKILLQGQIGRRDVAVLEKGGVIRVEKAEKL